MEQRSQTTSPSKRGKCVAIYGESLGDKFDRYHRDNPDVFGLFLNFTQKLKAEGRQRYSAKKAFEDMRWDTSIETHDVRLLELLFPEHRDFYNKRELRS